MFYGYLRIKNAYGIALIENILLESIYYGFHIDISKAFANQEWMWTFNH